MASSLLTVHWEGCRTYRDIEELKQQHCNDCAGRSQLDVDVVCHSPLAKTD